jgi:hypothetical protein
VNLKGKASLETVAAELELNSVRPSPDMIKEENEYIRITAL